jgi:hypothetical protein
MKSLTKSSSKKRVLFAVISIFIFSACQKQIDKPAPQEEISSAANDNNEHGHLKQTKEYSSGVLFRWIDFQLSIYKATGLAGPPAARLIGFTGLGAYESVVPGMPGYQSLSGQIQDLSDLPKTQPGYAYHWNECLNAALAYITTALFPGTGTAADTKTFSDGLYNEFKNEGASVEFLDRSKAFGEAVAIKVIACANNYNADYPADWATNPNPGPAAATESSFDINTGSWVRTSAAAASNPYWRYARLLVPGSLNGIQLTEPGDYAYNTAPGSDFRNMVEDVYNNTYNPHGLSLSERKAIAFYYGFTGYGGGHYLSIIKQVIGKANVNLDMAALAIAKAGISVYDASIGCFTVKYSNYVVRPQTYIRKVLGYTNPDGTAWTANLGADPVSGTTITGTPNHPEYPSGHSSFAGAVTEALAQQFGYDFSFTDTSFVHYYGATGLAARHFNSLAEFGKEIGDSRVYGQIHYPKSCEDGLALGNKVAQNVLNTLKFLKD